MPLIGAFDDPDVAFDSTTVAFDSGPVVVGSVVYTPFAARATGPTDPLTVPRPQWAARGRAYDPHR